jgi:catechol 2,3-dioxygenase-like lactoylglutathione lyase family enzyme
MIDHIGLRVGDYAAAKKFYEAALAPLGYRIHKELTPEMKLGYVGAGFGEQRAQFWIGTGAPGGPIHVAFQARDRKAVDAFYAAAIRAGAKDNGAPGLRPHYHENYYGAFVLDADGNNVEAACHSPA